MHSPDASAAEPKTPQAHRTPLLTTALTGVFLALCLFLVTHSATEPAKASFDMAEPGWVSMPAGARSSYLGIHGGTVPVSLLVTSTGNSLITFVGQTGNDFLALLRKAELRLPSLFNNSTEPKGDLLSNPRLKGTPSLRAGSAQDSMPVITLSDDSIFSLTDKRSLVQPFGLSDAPLRIEGSVSVPDRRTQQPRYHLLWEPGQFRPRQSQDKN